MWKRQMEVRIVLADMSAILTSFGIYGLRTFDGSVLRPGPKACM